MPVTLARDSERELTAELVDIGNGTSERDYAGKDVRGKPRAGGSSARFGCASRR